MPIYEYRCTKCGHEFEVVHAVGGSTARCEKCGGPVRRVFSSVGIIFKGPGFHVNDYRKTPAPADGGKPAGDGKAAGDGTAAGEGKPAGSAAASSEKTSGSASKTDGKAKTDTTATSSGAGGKKPAAR